VGAILVDWVDTNDPLFERLYGKDCPVLSAGDDDSIFRQLDHVVSLNEDALRSLRDKSIDWARRHLHWENRIGQLIDILNESTSR
jgi:hypothetical protein